MHAANDESAPFPTSTGSTGTRRAPYLFLLIGLGGAYALLLLFARLSPSFAALLSDREGGAGSELKLPLLAQLASLMAGLAALVLVLSHAVRKVDTRPYLAIAPFIAVFAGLVHAGLHVDLSGLGLSSGQVAFGALAVALLGGALIARPAVRGRSFGWALVIAPSALVGLVVTLAKGPAPLGSSERAYLLGLFVSTLLLGGAGIAARKLQRPEPQGEAADLEDDATLVFLGTRVSPATASTHARIAPRVTRVSPPVRSASRVKTGAMLGAVALVAYLGVDQLKQTERALRSDVSAGSSAASAVAPVVEQLPEPSKRGGSASATASRRERSEPARAAKSAAVRASAPAFSAPSRRASPPEPKRKRGSSSSRGFSGTQPSASASAALPAWGAEAMREFETPKGSKRGKKGKAGKDWAEADATPAPAASAPSSPSSSTYSGRPLASTAASHNAALAAQRAEPPKRVEPAKPEPPPPPAKPLTMDQLLNRVEAAAQAQKKGKKPVSKPKTQRDDELDALINNAVHSKGK